jgi:release factor glutamine methyltransferase
MERCRLHINERALRVARANCVRRAVGLVCSDMFNAVEPLSRFDFIVCNPPYVSGPEMAQLDTSVREFEPKTALEAGPDGLRYYRVLAAEASRYLYPGAALYCEIGHLQGKSAAALFSSPPWAGTTVFPDLAGRPRVLETRNGAP